MYIHATLTQSKEEILRWKSARSESHGLRQKARIIAHITITSMDGIVSQHHLLHVKKCFYNRRIETFI